MTIQATSWADKQKAGGPVGKLILFMMSDATDHGGICFADNEWLAEKCECSEELIERWMKRFEKRGLFTRIKDYDHNGKLVDIIKIHGEGL